jgi:hypothetical protein
MGSAVALMGSIMNACRIIVGKPERKRRLGRCKWDDNIKNDLREIG